MLSRVIGWAVVLAALPVVSGCGESESNTPAATAGATASNGGSASAGAPSGAGGSGHAGSANGGSASGGSASGGSASGGSGVGGSGDPTLCGGAYKVDCAAAKLCLFDIGTCGTAASCVRKPSSCDDVSEPTCGCDGKTYSNACEARRLGVSPQHEGACEEATQFACGLYSCANGHYCLDKGPNGDMPWRYACLTLPAACANEPSCTCLGSVKACFGGSTCAVTGVGVTATCK